MITGNKEFLNVILVSCLQRKTMKNYHSRKSSNQRPIEQYNSLSLTFRENYILSNENTNEAEESFMKQCKEKQHQKLAFLRKYLTQRNLIVIIALFMALCIVIIGMNRYISSESKTTKIGFEDIGELATQSAYCTEVNVTDASRELFGHEIPFTHSKYIYSYDVIIKAGFDFSEITWELTNNSIEVNLPEAQVLSCDIDMESFKIYHEEESIYRQISLEENNDALKSLKQTAQDNAIANGLLDNARSNVEIILTGFFSSVYNLEEYEINFTDK